MFDMSCLYLRHYDPDDVEILHTILVECGRDMNQRFDLSHWDPPIPLDMMRKISRERNLFGVHYRQGQVEDVVGTFAVRTSGWKYDLVDWSNLALKPLYLYKLAVRPGFQGKGIGAWCMRKVEDLARAWECQVIRFDAISKNAALLAFYQNLGYQIRGTRLVTDWRGKQWDITFFEKELCL
jgi:GNAT superfamily N-acetyltransferase